MGDAVGYHEFRHSKGRFRTTKVVNVAARDIKELEQFFFGETNDRNYLDSLANEPGLIWRKIGNRAALTRVFDGEFDTNGRSTLRFESLLMQPGWLPTTSTLTSLIQASWKLSGDKIVVKAVHPRAAERVHAERVSEVLLAVSHGQRIICDSREFTIADVAKIIESQNTDPSFSICFKALNERCPTTVALVYGTKGTLKMSASPTRQVARALARSSRPKPTRRAAAGTSTPLLAVVLVLVLVQLFFSWQASGSGNPAHDLDTMQDHLLDRMVASDANSKRELDALQSKFLDRLATTENSLEKDMETMLAAFDRKIESLSEDVNGLSSKVSVGNKRLGSTQGELGDKLDGFQKKIDQGFRQSHTNSQNLEKKIDDQFSQLKSLSLKIDELLAEISKRRKANRQR